MVDRLGPYLLGPNDTPENGIYTGDARELAKAIPGESVDLILTDPPFGVRKEEWDRLTKRQLAQFTMQWLAEAHRISARLVTWFSGRHRHLIEDLCAMLYPEVRLMFWAKPKGSQYAGSSHDKIWYSYELILYCHQGYDKPKAIHIGHMIQRARESKQLSRGAIDMVIRGKKTGLCYRWEEAACLPTRPQAARLCELLELNGSFLEALQDCRTKAQTAIATDVFTHRTVVNGNHPCAKPEALVAELIASFTEPNQIVFDPFTGGGTVPAVCKMLGRRYLAFEIDPDTAETARERVRTTQMPLFVLEPEQAEMGLADGS